MELILGTKFKNAVKKELDALWIYRPELKFDVEFNVNNILINGQKMGCSGMVINPRTSAVVYISTEKSSSSGLERHLYRYAKDERGWNSSGLINGNNRYAIGLGNLANSVVNLLAYGIGIPKDAPPEFYVDKVNRSVLNFDFFPEAARTEDVCWAAVTKDKSLGKKIKIKSKKILMYLGSECPEYTKFYFDEEDENDGCINN